AGRLEALHVGRKGRAGVVRRIQELDAGAIDHTVGVDVTDPAVHDTSLDDHGVFIERQAEFMERVELQLRVGLDLHAAGPDLGDDHRLEDHHATGQFAEDGHPISAAPFVTHGRLPWLPYWPVTCAR